MTKYLLLFTTLLFIFCGTVQADFYQWEDDNGNINITDYPPPAKFRKKVQVYKYAPAQAEAAKDAQKIDPDVVLFTKNSCNDCDKAREFLKAKNILFTEYNTDASEEAAKKRKTVDDSNDAPFAIINKNQVYGFSEKTYTKLLKVKP